MLNPRFDYHLLSLFNEGQIQVAKKAESSAESDYSAFLYWHLPCAWELLLPTWSRYLQKGFNLGCWLGTHLDLLHTVKQAPCKTFRGDIYRLLCIQVVINFDFAVSRTLG